MTEEGKTAEVTQELDRTNKMELKLLMKFNTLSTKIQSLISLLLMEPMRSTS